MVFFGGLVLRTFQKCAIHRQLTPPKAVSNSKKRVWGGKDRYLSFMVEGRRCLLTLASLQYEMDWGEACCNAGLDDHSPLAGLAIVKKVGVKRYARGGGYDVKASGAKAA